MRVLIVDDNPQSRRIAAQLLKEMNADVSEVSNEAHLVDRVQETLPQLLLVDVDTVGVRRVKECSRLAPQANILLMHSPGKLTEGFLGLLGVGRTDFLARPFVKSQLRHRIMNLAALWPALDLKTDPGAPKIPVVPKEAVRLRDPASGRLDAKRIAAQLGLPLKALTDALGRPYRTIHKTPDAVTLQPRLYPIARIVELLLGLLGKRNAMLAWLNTPLPDLSGERPIGLIKSGNAEAVRSLLEHVAAGAPT